MNERLNGLNSLAYLGVLPATPPQIEHQPRNPTTRDVNYNLGTLWHVENSLFIFMLGSLDNGIATWIQLSPGGGSGAQNFITDDGTATISGGTLDYFGFAPNITTVGTGNTLTLDLADDVQIFGTFTMSALGAGVVQQTNAGFISDNGTNGQVIIGADGSDVAWASITSSGTVTITPGANTLSLAVNAAAPLVFTADDMGTASPAANLISMPNTTNIQTVGIGSTVLIALKNTVTIGNDLAINNSFTVGTDLTIDGDLVFPNLSEGVLQSNNGLISSIDGPDGTTLIGGDINAEFASITSSTITITEGANTIDLSISGGGGSANPFLISKESTGVFYNTGQTAILGEETTLTILYDVGNDFFVGDGMGAPATFTAPIDGKYHLTFLIQPNQNNLMSNPTNITWQAKIDTPGGSYEFNYTNRAIVGSLPTTSGSSAGILFTPLIQLDMGDEVTFEVTEVTVVGTTRWSIPWFTNIAAGFRIRGVIHGYQVA